MTLNINGEEYKQITKDGKFLENVDVESDDMVYVKGEWYIKNKLELDYEVLAYKNGDCIVDINLECCKKWKYPIWKIKRKLDGEIFTIGDEIYHSNSRPEEAKITEFKTNGIFATTVITDTHGSITLNYATKFLRFKFECEDGIITDKTLNPWYVSDDFKVIDVANLQFIKEPLVGFKYFTTKFSLNEYILKNKPLLSYKDIMEIVMLKMDNI